MPTANPLVDTDQVTVPSPAYPAKIKQASADIAGIATDVAVYSFTDKIMVTVSQGGRLGTWLTVPLDPTSPLHSTALPPPPPPPSNNQDPNEAQFDEQDNDALLPLLHLTPSTLLGAGTPARQTTGQLLAAQIASSVVARNPDEGRAVLVGLGLEREEVSREGWIGLLEAVGGCL